MNRFEFEDSEYSPENSSDSPLPTMPSQDSKVASTSTSKRSRRAIQKRVVSVPIKDLLRVKGDLMSSPPSDSWTWRKYGQKPIKGSPYPRGYYRCSSSKGCPARKQVERSKSDPNIIVVTYSYEHNHPWPSTTSRNNHHHSRTTAVTTPISEEEEEDEEEMDEDEEKKLLITTPPNQPQEITPENKFPVFDGSLINCSVFGGWFNDFESTILLESPISTEDRIANDEVATIFGMCDEDDSLFADLGELPECSAVFRRELAQQEAVSRGHNLATSATG